MYSAISSTELCLYDKTLPIYLRVYVDRAYRIPLPIVLDYYSTRTHALSIGAEINDLG